MITYSKTLTCRISKEMESTLLKVAAERKRKLTELVREALEELIRDHEKRLYGYSGSAGSVAATEKQSSKDLRKEAMAKLRSTSDKDVTSFVHSLGFSPNDTKPQPDGILNTYYFKDNWWVHHYSYFETDGVTPKPFCPPFEEQVYDREALIRELIKAKLI